MKSLSLAITYKKMQADNFNNNFIVPVYRRSIKKKNHSVLLKNMNIKRHLKSSFQT